MGQQQRGLVVTEVPDGELSEGFGIMRNADGLVQHARGSVEASDIVQTHLCPLIMGDRCDVGEEGSGAFPQGSQ